MDIFGVLKLIGGLSLFLFGMSLMGTGLEKSAGNKLKGLLEKLTSNKLNGFFIGVRRYSHHPKLLRHNRHGGRVC